MPETIQPLFDHVALRVRELSLSRAFYEQALKPFDVRVVQSSQGPLGFVTDGRGDLWIKEGTPGAGSVHIAFVARDRSTVEAFHRVAVSLRGAVCYCSTADGRVKENGLGFGSSSRSHRGPSANDTPRRKHAKAADSSNLAERSLRYR